MLPLSAVLAVVTLSGLLCLATGFLIAYGLYKNEFQRGYDHCITEMRKAFSFKRPKDGHKL